SRGPPPPAPPPARGPPGAPPPGRAAPAPPGRPAGRDRGRQLPPGRLDPGHLGPARGRRPPAARHRPLRLDFSPRSGPRGEDRLRHGKGPGMRVLVVEDERRLAAGLRNGLAAEG